MKRTLEIDGYFAELVKDELRNVLTEELKIISDEIKAELRKLHTPAPPPPPAKYLTMEQTQKLLNVSSSNTIKKYLKNGTLRGERVGGTGHWRFPASQFDQNLRLAA